MLGDERIIKSFRYQQVDMIDTIIYLRTLEHAFDF